MKLKRKIKLASAVKSVMPHPGFELSEDTLEKLKTFNRALLYTVAAAGVVSVALIAPNALQVLHKLMRMKGKSISPRAQEQKLLKAFYYLKGKGFVHMRQAGEEYHVEITEPGKKQLQKLAMAIPVIARPKSWDGKFWQLAADIPNRFRAEADSFRRKVKCMGFYPLQRTLWYYPFDPRQTVAAVADSYGLTDYVTVMKVELFDERDLKVIIDHFHAIQLI